MKKNTEFLLLLLLISIMIASIAFIYFHDLKYADELQFVPPTGELSLFEKQNLDEVKVIECVGNYRFFTNSSGAYCTNRSVP